MDRTQKTKLKKKLLKLREDVMDKVKHIQKDNLGQSQRDASGDLSGYSLHMADVASDNFEREMLLGLAGSEHDLLYSIDSALKRLKEKSFGICTKCEKNISIKRLSAVPYTQLCIKCQEKEDKET